MTLVEEMTLVEALDRLGMIQRDFIAWSHAAAHLNIRAALVMENSVISSAPRDDIARMLTDAIADLNNVTTTIA
ncbi:MAG TPA: hypothetical protein VGP28_09540, partial [Methylocella sp.]|nr:hypothetical protein [Methylocella sp.]